jgi:hypothetical protein
MRRSPGQEDCIPRKSHITPFMSLEDLTVKEASPFREEADGY